MRLLALLLILANLAFFAWWRYYAPAGPSEPGPASRQIEPGKLPVVPPPRSLADANVQPVSLTCMEWGGFDASGLVKAEQALEPLALGAAPTTRQVDGNAWWVYIPPQGGRDAALKKTAELKLLGIDDYFIVQEEGDYRWAVSLGIFSSEAAANSRLELLRNRKVRSAQVGQRDLHPVRSWLQMRDLTPLQLERLRGIAKQLGDTELRSCS